MNEGNHYLEPEQYSHLWRLINASSMRIVARRIGFGYETLYRALWPGPRGAPMRKSTAEKVRAFLKAEEISSLVE